MLWPATVVADRFNFGSEADIEASQPDVRFTPKSGHAVRLAVDFENFDRSTRRTVVKDADCRPPSIPGKGIEVGPRLLEDRPMCMPMVAVYNVELVVAAVVSTHRISNSIT
jgi:hypothetical protein